MTGQSLLLGTIAGVVAALSFIPYFISILRGQTKPNRATWGIWFVCGLWMAVSYYGVGARETMWVPIIYVVGPGIVLLLSVWYGVGGWSRFDKCCLAAAMFSVVPLALGQPGMALFSTIAVDFCGLMPTIRKTYKHPEQEDWIAWSLGLCANVLNLVAVGSWNMAEVILPLYMTLTTVIMLSLLFTPKWR